MKEIWKFIRHNQGMFLGGVIVIAVLVWTYGCESEVTSILYTPNFVNRGQLQIEVDTFIAQAELRFAELNKQDQLKSTLFNTAIDFMQGGKINPVAVALVISSILGIGAGADNIRKRTHINTLKSNAATSPPQA